VMENSDSCSCSRSCLPECKLVFKEEIHRVLSEGEVEVELCANFVVSAAARHRPKIVGGKEWSAQFSNVAYLFQMVFNSNAERISQISNISAQAGDNILNTIIIS